MCKVWTGFNSLKVPIYQIMQPTRCTFADYDTHLVPATCFGLLDYLQWYKSIRGRTQRTDIGKYSFVNRMEQTDCSETSAYKLQTPSNYPKEIIQHTEHGESLKSRIIKFWNQLPAEVLATYPCKEHSFRKRGRKVIISKRGLIGWWIIQKGVEWSGVKWGDMKWSDVKSSGVKWSGV